MTASENFSVQEIHDTQIPQERMGLEGLLLILRRQARIAILLIATIMGAAAFYLQSVEERYVTRATIVLTPSETRISRTAAQLESFDVSRSIVETELDVLRSRQFAAALAERPSLATRSIFVPAPDAPAMSATELRARIIDRLLESYSVFRSGESLAIEIVAETPDPELTAAIANGVAQTYIARSERSQRAEIQQSIAFLETRAASMSAELSEMELEFADFVRANGLDDADRLDRLLWEEMRLSAIVDALEGEAGQEADLVRHKATLVEIEERLREHTAATLTLGRMERALNLEQTRYQNAVERLNQLETQLDFVARSARHVTVARVPVEPAWPNHAVALALCFVAATILAFVTALLMESLNRRVWTEADVQRIVGLRNYGTVPRIPRRGIRLRRPPPLEYLSADPRSFYNEGLRGILTLLLKNHRANNAKVLMIASSLPDEGKSEAALSMAGSAARDGLRVLLLDFDVHRESVTALAGEKSETLSLRDLVEHFDNAEVSEGATDVSSLGSEDGPFPLGTPVELADGLHFISVGARERLNFHVLQDVQTKLMPQLRRHYDLILLDAPPVLVFNDACRFGTLADAVLIVVRWGQSKGNELRETHDRLKRSGSNILGTVFNDVDPREQRRYRTGAYLGRAAYAKYRLA
jgi:succinoglycan biosynthesis transport protein ExoP